MWGLPKNLRPHLEKALVKIEAEFREAISKPESRAWPKRKAAIEKAMQSSFAAFAAQTPERVHWIGVACAAWAHPIMTTSASVMASFRIRQPHGSNEPDLRSERRSYRRVSNGDINERTRTIPAQPLFQTHSR